MTGTGCEKKKFRKKFKKKSSKKIQKKISKKIHDVTAAILDFGCHGQPEVGPGTGSRPFWILAAILDFGPRVGVLLLREVTFFRES